MMNRLITGKPGTLTVELFVENGDGTRSALTGSPEVTGALVGVATGEGLLGGITFTQGSGYEWSASLTSPEISGALLEFDDATAPFVEDVTARGRVVLQVHIAGNYNRGHEELIEVSRGQI